MPEQAVTQVTPAQNNEAPPNGCALQSVNQAQLTAPSSPYRSQGWTCAPQSRAPAIHVSMSRSEFSLQTSRTATPANTLPVQPPRCHGIIHFSWNSAGHPAPPRSAGCARAGMAFLFLHVLARVRPKRYSVICRPKNRRKPAQVTDSTPIKPSATFIRIVLDKSNDSAKLKNSRSTSQTAAFAPTTTR